MPAYKYLSGRGEYYSSRLHDTEPDRRDLRTIKTEDIDTECGGVGRERKHAIPGEITRDTTLNIRGGKPVVRIVTQKAKETPQLHGWRAKMASEDSELTLGQRLAMKHQISERPKPAESPPRHGQPAEGSAEESDWTWETCSSSSEADGYEYTVMKTKKNNKNNKTTTPPPKRKPPEVSKAPPSPPPRRAAVAYTKSNTTTLCSSDDKTAIRTQAPPTPNSAVRNRWLDSMFNEPKPKPQTPSERIPNLGSAVSASKGLLDRRRSKEVGDSPASAGSRAASLARPVSWAGQAVQDVQGNVHTGRQESEITTGPAAPAASVSSGSSSSSPPLYKAAQLTNIP